MSTVSGKVAWFNNAKGYGFLKHEGGTDVFVHHTAIDMEGYKTLREGEAVEFEIEKGSKGKDQATHVKRVSIET